MRSNIELPQVLIDELKFKAEGAGMSPGAVLREIIRHEGERMAPESLHTGRINVSLGEDELKIISELQEHAQVKRGDKISPGSMQKVIESLLRKHFKFL